jgi:putative transposase
LLNLALPGDRVVLKPICRLGRFALRRRHLDLAPVLATAAICGLFRVYVKHYNTHRPHRSLELVPPAAVSRKNPVARSGDLKRHDRLGGLIHEYSYAA